jgi:hypothetical protein
LRDEYERLQEYEAEYSPGFEDEKNDMRSLEVLRSIWQMFDAWVAEAEPIYRSVVRLSGVREAVPELDQLRDNIGFARARLAGTPESLLKGIQQLRRGEGIRTTVEELRNELRARRGA